MKLNVAKLAILAGTISGLAEGLLVPAKREHYQIAVKYDASVQPLKTWRQKTDGSVEFWGNWTRNDQPPPWLMFYLNSGFEGDIVTQAFDYETRAPANQTVGTVSPCLLPREA